MAFYSSNYYESSSYYEDDSGEYAFPPYYDSFNSTTYQDSETHNSIYEFNENQNFSYYPPPDYAAYDPTASTWSRISYSAVSFRPNYITFYDQPPDYYPAQTQLTISYSVSDYNVPEFEEYDPKPYSGGYDIAATYGEPLPPSDKTCYPRSSGSSVDPSSLPLVPATLPTERESSTAIEPQIKPGDLVPATLPTERETSTAIEPQSKPRALGQDEETNTEKHEDGYGNEAGTSDELSGADGYYNHEKQLPQQVPPGYGLEAMDLCESLFGPWPCLTRGYRRGYGCQDQGVADYDGCQDQGVADYDGCRDQWNGAVDYLFGSSYPYAERNSGLSSYEDAIHAYQRRHYQENPLHQQVGYTSWFG